MDSEQVKTFCDTAPQLLPLLGECASSEQVKRSRMTR